MRSDILLRALAFVGVIILGYILKKLKFYHGLDSKFVNKTVINIVLPAAIISSFGSFHKDNTLFILIILGLLFNLMLVWIGYIFSKKNESGMKALYMLCFPGYNIGAFTLPFIQSILGSYGVVALCMFDIGNSISCTGGSYAITSSVIDEKKKLSFKFLVEKLRTSVPFITYILMLILVFFNLKLPKPILAFTSLIGNSNGFLSMFMIGLMFDIKLKKEYLLKAMTILSVRYTVAVLLALLIYWGFNFSDLVTKVLILAVFSPLSALSPIFVEKCGGDMELASFTNSLSIIISVAVMTFITFIF